MDQSGSLGEGVRLGSWMGGVSWSLWLSLWRWPRKVSFLGLWGRAGTLTTVPPTEIVWYTRAVSAKG